MGVIAGLLGSFISALVITFVVTRAAIRFTGRTRKGALGAFLIGLAIMYGLRVAVWQILDNGDGDISIALIAYAVALTIWLVRDYRKAKPEPLQTAAEATSTKVGTARSRLNAKLDHPFKRVAALFATLGLTMLTGASLGID